MRKPYGSDVASLAKAERHKHAAPEKVSETVLAIAKKEERRAHAQPMAAYRPLFTESQNGGPSYFRTLCTLRSYNTSYRKFRDKRFSNHRSGRILGPLTLVEMDIRVTGRIRAYTTPNCVLSMARDAKGTHGKPLSRFFFYITIVLLYF